MRVNPLLGSLVPGFAPILIYIVVEALAGETAGLIAGLALGLGEFIFILIKERRVDPFTLVDTLLLAGMGGLSWALSSPLLFRLKPAISEAIMAALILLGALGPHRYFLPYMEKKMNMGELPAPVAKRMVAMIAGFGLLTLAHAGLTAAALWWGKLAWDFVAGALFWIMSIVYIAAWTLPAFLARARIMRQQKRDQAQAPSGRSSRDA
jgi:intracellular septation protein A